MRPYILALIFSLATAVAYAQPGDPSGNPTVPITGIEILIALGGALGIKGMLSTKKQK